MQYNRVDEILEKICAALFEVTRVKGGSTVKIKVFIVTIKMTNGLASVSSSELNSLSKQGSCTLGTPRLETSHKIYNVNVN